MLYLDRLRRTTAVLGLATLATAPTVLLLFASPATITAATSPGADAPAMLAGLAVVAAWVVTARLVVTALAVALAALPGAMGRHGRGLATCWSPSLLRGVVRAALGASMVAGPLLSGPLAFADQPRFPTLDRAIALVAAPVAGTHSTTHVGNHPRVRPRAGGAGGAGHVVVVHPGDTLWDIAARGLPAGHSAADVARSWPRWYAANRSLIGADPGQIRPGQRLVPPG